MLDLEERIRAELTRQSDDYVPPTDLPDRIDARVRGRRTRRSVTALSVAAALVLVLGVAGALVLAPGTDRTDIGPSDAPPSVPTPTTTLPDVTVPGSTVTEGTDASAPTTTRAVSPTGPTSTTFPPAPTTSMVPSPAFGSGTPMHRSGAGPVFAGQSLAEAAERSRTTIDPDEPLGPGSTCTTATVRGTDFVLMVAPPSEPGADPMKGVIRQVKGGTTTVDGFAVGDDVQAVHDALGAPTDATSAYGNTYEVFEADGFAYVVTFDAAGTVIDLAAGYPEVYVEGCA
jgi:hypothetical protein